MFTIRDYPKSYGNIRLGFYRLIEFQDSHVGIAKLETDFWKFVSSIADSTPPRKNYKSYKLLNAGWEWSVFYKDSKSVLKIPAGVFEEVDEKQYLDNTKFAYQKILEYFPENFVASTKFGIRDGVCVIEQSYVDGKKHERIGYNTKNFKLLSHLKIFLTCALQMLDHYRWLPDFDIQRSSNGFVLRNVIFHSNIPKIVDFTAYYDVYRLYPERTIEEVEKKKHYIVDFLSWVERKQL